MKSNNQRTKLEIFCASLIFVALFFSVHANFGEAQISVEDHEALLQAELAATEAEITAWQSELREKQQESASYKRDIDILNAKIQKAQALIKAGQINIEKLRLEIDLKLNTIEELDKKVDKGKESLSQLIRRTDEINSFNMVEILLSSEDLSEFLIDLDTFNSVNDGILNSFEEIRNAKNELEIERQSLGEKVDKETDIKKANEAERRRVEANEAEQKRLLNISRSQERSYELEIVAREKRAAQIRAALFSLRDTAAIPFGDALDYANAVFQKTGVRPAFLLAIITQESNMGANIGTCNRPQDSQKWRDIMPGPGDSRNDQAAFLRITSKLGFDPDSMPLSCPWGNGWGGAMGPSQFIPTTWEAYENKVAQALGKSVVNPWNPQDAFMASGVYLSELGAGAGGYTAERTAALKYYAGGNWNKPKNAFYGDQVMAQAQTIQETMIDPLTF